mmetsp:Transcript_17171/g.27790  ORF Transcript_17171/g.27790 Transcript_17171/m.27790 type:complete len:97 (-) Transcript_17171:503-793(-)
MAADDRDRPPPTKNIKCACQQMQAKEWDPSSPKIGHDNKTRRGGVLFPRVELTTNNNNYKQTSRLIFETGSSIFLGSNTVCKGVMIHPGLDHGTES